MRLVAFRKHLIHLNNMKGAIMPQKIYLRSKDEETVYLKMSSAIPIS